MLSLPAIEQGHRTANGFVYENLLDAILQGEIPPGTRLTEQMLVDWLKVSRTPIREALRRLETEGLVKTIPYRGAMVNLLNSQEIKDEYTIRAALEGLAAELAVNNISDEKIDDLAALNIKMQATFFDGDLDGFLDLNYSFHLEFYSCSNCPRLLAMIDASWRKINIYRRFFYKHAKGLEFEETIHEELLQACRDREPQKAHQIMQKSCFDAAEYMSEMILQMQAATNESDLSS
jgi:DNA-binding GntR family transcriptional regulator